MTAISGAGWVLVFLESFGAGPHLTIEQNVGNIQTTGIQYHSYPGANFKYAPVPEPSTLALCLLGLTLAGGATPRRRGRRN